MPKIGEYWKYKFCQPSCPPRRILDIAYNKVYYDICECKKLLGGCFYLEQWYRYNCWELITVFSRYRSIKEDE